MRNRRPTLLRGTAVLAGALFAVACSSGPGSVKRAEVEKDAATELAAAVKSSVKPNISCPHDLTAKVGEKMDCQLSVTGDPAHYPVHVTVTSISGSRAHMTFEVAQSPAK